jgi:hypothetical protein
MQIEKFVHTGVKNDGTFNKAGAVVTTGSVRMSNGEGCCLPNCHCSDGYWVTIIMPRTKDGKVEGIQCHLTKQEMNKLLQKHTVDGK